MIEKCKMFIDKTSDATNAETALVNETLHFIETGDLDDKPQLHEVPFFHNDKLSQSSTESESENSDDETAYGWSTDDDTEEYSFFPFDTKGSDAQVCPTNSK